MIDTSVEEHQRRKRAIDWSLCILCQKNTGDDLQDPQENKRCRKDKALSTLEKNLPGSQKLGKVPCMASVEALSCGLGIRPNIVLNEGRWHKNCLLKCSSSKFETLRRQSRTENVPPSEPILTRRSSDLHEAKGPICAPICQFCAKPAARAFPLSRCAQEGILAIKAIAILKSDTKTLVIREGCQGNNSP